VKPRFHGPGGDPESVGDVIDRQVRPETKDDGDAQVDIQSVDGCQEVALTDEPVVGIGRRLVGRLGVDRNEPDDPAASQAIATDVDEDPVEPRLEPRWISERPDAIPRTNEGVVRRVLGVVEAAKDQAGETVGAVELDVRESGEPRLRFGRRRSVQRVPLDVRPTNDPSLVQTIGRGVSFSGSRKIGFNGGSCQAAGPSLAHGSEVRNVDVSSLALSLSPATRARR